MNRKKRPRKERASRYIPSVLLEIAGGMPAYEKSNVGAPPRSPTPKSPEILARQIKVFELRTHGYAVAQIAETLHLARNTVLSDHAAELMRRLDETKPKKTTLVQQTISRLEAVMARASGRITKLTADANNAPPGSRARTDSFAGVERAEKNFLAAVNQWNEVYDLKRPASNVAENFDNTDVKILRLLDLMPVEELIALREDAAALEKRLAEDEKMVHVTPQDL